VYLLEQEDVVTVYLKNSLQTLSDRLFAEKGHRPLVSHLESKDEMVDFVRKHLFERSHYYNQAEIIIDGSEMTLGETTEKIILKLF
jgi:shikimate kinase